MAQPYDMPLEELKNYKPNPTKQPDFEEFWQKSLCSLAEVPVEYELEPYSYPVRGVKVYRISYLGFKSANIDGWLVFFLAQLYSALWWHMFWTVLNLKAAS